MTTDEPIHFFQTFDRFTLSQGVMVARQEHMILCGKKDGEADNRKRFVTCPRCVELLAAFAKAGRVVK